MTNRITEISVRFSSPFPLPGFDAALPMTASLHQMAPMEPACLIAALEKDRQRP